jgi:hypothetical protein
VEVYAKAPDQRATRVHYRDPERGDVNRTFDGRGGWLATPLTVLPEYAQIPFRWTMGWLDGLDTYQLSEVKLNAPVDPAKFGRPSASAPKR